MIPSFPWIAPGWIAPPLPPRKGRDQILQLSGAIVQKPEARRAKHIGSKNLAIYSHLATMGGVGIKKSPNVVDVICGLSLLSVSLPDRLRGGRVERLVDYLKSVAGDYMESVQQVRDGVRWDKCYNESWLS